MSGYVMAQAGYADVVAVVAGPRLLSGILYGPALPEHRRIWPAPPRPSARELLAVLGMSGIAGRGGAGFPFVRKVATAVQSGRRRELVVNGSEGEPGSAKDSALLTTAPHLVLDGAQAVASALRVDHAHIVVPGERPAVEHAVRAALAERRNESGLDWTVHVTAGGFVGGQARAVLELIAGRPNLPVTSWTPEAVSGLNGRPTLLSNAETFAQAAALLALGPAGYARQGTAEEPGTTLLTVAGDGPDGVVLEVPHGARLVDCLAVAGYDASSPLLVGGYHGGWLTADEVLRRRVSRSDLAQAGVSLGAGVLLPVDPQACPVAITARVVAYLTRQSAGRCGPCRFGLPALSAALNALAEGSRRPARARAEEVAALVTGRGACAHPDGTARLLRSLLQVFPAEVAAHERGRCTAVGVSGPMSAAGAR